MIDYQILKLFCQDKSLFIKYHEIANFSDTLLKNILEQLKLYYTHSNENYIGLDNLISICCKVYNDDIYRALVKEIYAITINQELIDNLLDILYKKYIIYNVDAKLKAKFAANDFSTIDDLKELFLEEIDEHKHDFADLSIEELIKDEKDIKWPLGCLDSGLGSPPTGTFGGVFGRVEVGKTAFITNASCSFRRQGLRVLHFNNEDPLRKLLERYYINWFGVPKTTLYEHNPTTTRWKLYDAAIKFKEQHTGHLFIVDTAECSLYRIDLLIKSVNPDVVFIDQVDALGNDIDPSSLELLYKNVRKIAKRRNTRIIGVTQASATDELYLTMDSLHNSKVGKPAAFDYLIGLGKSHAVETIRYISIPKNKLTGDHAKFTCTFDPALIQYKD